MRTQSIALDLAHALALSFAISQAACAPVDNSGGPPPAGDELEVEVLALSGTCGTFRDEAFLVKDQATLDAFLGACEIPEAARAAWQTAVDALADDEALVYANVSLGGCLGAFAVQGAFLDGTTVNAWVLREDTSYGNENTPCTDDLGEGGASIKVSGVAAATEAKLTIGDFNPNLPGAPQIVVPQ